MSAPTPGPAATFQGIAAAPPSSHLAPLQASASSHPPPLYAAPLKPGGRSKPDRWRAESSAGGGSCSSAGSAPSGPSFRDMVLLSRPSSPASRTPRSHRRPRSHSPRGGPREDINAYNLGEQGQQRRSAKERLGPRCLDSKQTNPNSSELDNFVGGPCCDLNEEHRAGLETPHGDDSAPVHTEEQAQHDVFLIRRTAILLGSRVSLEICAQFQVSNTVRALRLPSERLRLRCTLKTNAAITLLNTVRVLRIPTGMTRLRCTLKSKPNMLFF
ncbi:hypothetical protein ZEAMMB73_Zm00001d014133 [Zea mays]|uniref:Uncharacterized protein n=1 Tax=Zea mays TaxID=4577 RepID=A0A1D6GQ64_MAIZE|nr:hypothetical protein ZEAMMB73_Zm00001d014133 [Zea mays]